MTAWLVALVGFQVNVEVFALPLIGMGMFLRLTGGEHIWGQGGRVKILNVCFCLEIYSLKKDLMSLNDW